MLLVFVKIAPNPTLDIFPSVSDDKQIFSFLWNIEELSNNLADKLDNFDIRELSNRFTGKQEAIVIQSPIKDLDSSEISNKAVEKAKNADYIVVCVGVSAAIIGEEALVKGMSKQQVLFFDTAADAISTVTGLLKKGDAVLVKGSREMKMEIIANAIEEVGNVISSSSAS